MSTTTAAAETKTFASPDETRTFERGVVELVDIAGTQIGRLTLQPGCRVSRPIWVSAMSTRSTCPRSKVRVSSGSAKVLFSVFAAVVVMLSPPASA